MKIRNGFVSNSSTTSFCIYGITVETNKINDIITDLINNGKINVKYLTDLKGGWICSTLEHIFKEYDMEKLEVHSGPYEDVIYIGRSWKTVSNTETGQDFKNDTEDKINSIFSKLNPVYSTHEVAWRDG